MRISIYKENHKKEPEIFLRLIQEDTDNVILELVDAEGNSLIDNGHGEILQICDIRSGKAYIVPIEGLSEKLGFAVDDQRVRIG